MMNSNLMAGLTIVVVIALFAVLIGFVRYLTLTLENTGGNLVEALSVTTTIRQDCENIVSGVLALNKNLHAAAAGLGAVVNAAQQAARASRPAVVPVATPREPASDSRPSARWAARDANGSTPDAGAPRRLREPVAAATSPTSAAAVAGMKAIGASRREFRIRGSE